MNEGNEELSWKRKGKFLAGVICKKNERKYSWKNKFIVWHFSLEKMIFYFDNARVTDLKVKIDKNNL